MIPADAKPAILPDGSEYTYTNFFRHGWGGVLRGAAIVFFAFIGFDAVSTAAQEAKNPKKDMPIGILGSLVICTFLYVLFSWVLTGVAPYTDFVRAGKEASVAYAIETYMTNYHWLAKWVTVGILAGFSSVILVMLLGQSRVFYSMANDGLLPKVFCRTASEIQNTVQIEYSAYFFLWAPSPHCCRVISPATSPVSAPCLHLFWFAWVSSLCGRQIPITRVRSEPHWYRWCLCSVPVYVSP